MEQAWEELAESLRGRLIERARAGAAGDGSLEGEVRALVEAEAPALSGDEVGGEHWTASVRAFPRS